VTLKLKFSTDSHCVLQQVAKGMDVTDYRLFVRCIIRHSDLISKEASYEYLHNEGEKTLMEAMDSLEVAFSHNMVGVHILYTLWKNVWALDNHLFQKIL